MPLCCPKCGSEEFFFVEKTTNYWLVNEIKAPGNIELGEMVSSFTDDSSGRYECEDCYWVGYTQHYLMELQRTRENK